MDTISQEHNQIPNTCHLTLFFSSNIFFRTKRRHKVNLLMTTYRNLEKYMALKYIVKNCKCKFRDVYFTLNDF